MDKESVASILEGQYPGLLRLLQRKLRDEQLAADVLNQALVVSLEHLDAGRVGNPAAIAGYVFQVAMNQVRNHRRKFDERSDNKAPLDELERAVSSPEESDFDGRMCAQVREIVRSLSTERDREIVRRFYFDEDDKDVICKDLGLSSLHFDRVIFRARQRMRTLLEAKGFHKLDFFVFFCAILYCGSC